MPGLGEHYPGHLARTKQAAGSESDEIIVNKEAHIIGGDTAELGEFPWAAALFIDGVWF